MTKTKTAVAIIPARGGSKGIPGKNIIEFCGKPLIAWSIEACLRSGRIKDVYVSTDDAGIEQVSAKYGAKIVRRPAEFATDTASSEAALVHAVDEIEKSVPIDAVVFLQATSPLRTPDDVKNAVDTFFKDGCDSLFSAAILDDFCIWKKQKEDLTSLTYDYKNRGRRQDREPHFLENGSIYIFKPEILHTLKNRLGGRIGMYFMDFWKSFEIDKKEDLELCRLFMERHILSK